MARAFLLVVTATAVAATSLQAEENAKAWLQAYDDDPDSLGGLQASNPDAYNIVKGLLDKREKGKLDYEHPISDISYSDESTLLAAPASKASDQSESSNSFSESDYEKEAPPALRSSKKESDDAGVNFKVPLEDEDSAVEKALGAVEAVTGRSVPRKHAVEEVSDDAPQSSESWGDISNAMTGLSLGHAHHKEEAKLDDQVEKKRSNRYLRVQAPSPADSLRNSRKSALADDEASLDEDLKPAEDKPQAHVERVNEPKKNPYMDTLGGHSFQESQNHGWRSWEVEKGNPYLQGFDLKLGASQHQSQPESTSDSMEAHHQTALMGFKSVLHQANEREHRWGHWRLHRGTYKTRDSEVVENQQETQKSADDVPDYQKIEEWLSVGNQKVSMLRIKPIEGVEAYRKRYS
eukprot:TRINITY_DN2044_c0_g1_i2.p1 TRINITY_DN2044_c0_g1~~TRINITY_DN2044_c0_g1_i2.p1  ORF type:complete len:424 (+),score=110.32 TRINITY_DN2044_c0_g1_i2:57-1274(+)